MKKKPAKRTATDDKVNQVERERRAEIATLRRLRDQQRRITALARDLRRAVRGADVARLEAARELCADTGWGVFDVDLVGRIEQQLEDALAKVITLEANLRDLKSFEPSAVV